MASFQSTLSLGAYFLCYQNYDVYPFLMTIWIWGGFYYPNKCIGRGLKHHNEMDRYPLNPKRIYRAIKKGRMRWWCIRPFDVCYFLFLNSRHISIAKAMAMPAKRISLTWLFPPVAAKEHTGTAAITSAMVRSIRIWVNCFFIIIHLSYTIMYHIGDSERSQPKDLRDGENKIKKVKQKR